MHILCNLREFQFIEHLTPLTNYQQHVRGEKFFQILFISFRTTLESEFNNITEIKPTSLAFLQSSKLN